MSTTLAGRIRRRQPPLICILALLVLVNLSGCSESTPPPPAPEPTAKPTIIERNLSMPVFGTNEMAVRVRNDGDDGLVRVAVVRKERISHWERGESGVEKSLREAFTREVEPSPVQRVNYRVIGRWEKTIHMPKGATKDVTLELPGHSTWDAGTDSVSANGVIEDG